MSRIRPIFKMFLQFMKFGCFTFGGGWSIVAQMQKLYVEKEKTITDEELLDLTSVGRSLPGTMICNVAMLYGYRSCGVLGGIACVVGMVIPPMIVLSVITLFYTAFESNPWVIAAMSGVRASIVPIIAAAAFGMVKGAFRIPPCILVAVIAFALYTFLSVSCIWLVVIGAVCGIIIGEIYERRGRGGNDPD